MAHHRKISPPSTKHIVLLFVVLLLFTTGFLKTEQPKLASVSPLTGEAALLEAVRKAQCRDKEAFNTLYQWYYPQIYKHLFRLVGNSEDASDLAAETFLKAWCGLPDLHDVLRFRGWLFRIATNKALDFLRRRRGHQPSWEYLSEYHTDEQATALESRVEQTELVRLALMRVAPKPLACLLLQLEGFDHAEIAELVGLGKKSVGTYVSMAREQFRQAYYQLECSKTP
jgi:RNA polymerase sigma-70 factor, ECF subfamily